MFAPLQSCSEVATFLEPSLVAIAVDSHQATNVAVAVNVPKPRQLIATAAAPPKILSLRFFTNLKPWSTAPLLVVPLMFIMIYVLVGNYYVHDFFSKLDQHTACCYAVAKTRAVT